MKKIFYVLCLCASALCFSGCLNKSDSKIKAAGLFRSDTETFLNAYTAALVKAAGDNDVDFKLYFCNKDAAVQIDQVKNLLMNGVKYFVIAPVDTGLTEQIVRLIHSKGGAVAFSNVQPSDAALDVGKNVFYVSSAETSAGDFQAQILDEYFKKNPKKISSSTIRLLYLNGEVGHSAQIFRRMGFIDGITKRGYKVEIVAEGTANWAVDTARQLTDNWIARGAVFDAVIAQNDDMALGAIESLVANKYVEDPSLQRDIDGDGTVLSVPVLGIDATDKARDSIKAHKLYATVLQDASGQAQTALEVVLQCARHGNAKGFSTKAGIKALEEVSKESPANRASVIDQCFMVPFVPVTE